MSLAGTIPVNIRGKDNKKMGWVKQVHNYSVFVVCVGSTYNIPVCIYLRKDHPYYPPYCFVVPATGMSLSPSRYMDSRGMVYLPNLIEWRQVSQLYKYSIMYIFV